jgi:hypothetical protein
MAEKLTTEQVLADLGRTNINNIKHIKHLNTNKHLNTFNDFTPSGNHQTDDFVLVASPPEVSSPAPQPVRVALATVEARPWRFIKADLFDNATPQMLAKNRRKFNLKLSFLLHNESEYQYLGAALNTPWRNVKRGFDFSDPDQLEHYNTLERVYQRMSKAGLDRIRASKCYEPTKKGKGATIFGTSVVIGQDLETSEYLIALIIYDQIYDLTLNGKTLSDAQRSANCIASTQQGDMISPRKTAKDFFRIKK